MTNLGKCRLYRIYAFLTYCIPMIILFAVNNKAYMAGGSAFGFWAYILLFFCLIAFKNIFLKWVEKRATLVMSAVLMIFSLMMIYLAEEMLLICAVSLVASILSYFVDVVADVYYANAWIAVNGNTQNLQRNTARALPDREAWRIAYGVDEVKHGE